MIREMSLTIQTPDRQALRSDGILKIVAEAPDGLFCLLPRHIDFVTLLVPGILSCSSALEESWWAVDRGLLVKCAGEVRVSTTRAIRGEELGVLRAAVRRGMAEREQREEEVRRAVDRLEAGFLRHFIELEKEGGAGYG